LYEPADAAIQTHITATSGNPHSVTWAELDKTVSDLADLATKNHSDLNDDEASKHRLINDSSTSSTELWSSDKISTELSGKSDTGHDHSGTYEPADAAIQSHITATSGNPHSVSASDIGLGNVTNDAQVKKAGSSTDDEFVSWNGTSGDAIQDSGYSASDFAAAGHDHSGTYEPANANIQSHISSTSNPHGVDASDVLSSGTLVGLIEQMTGHIETVADKTYVLDQSAAYAYDIDTLIIKSASGTCTAKIQIEAVDVTGISAVSVSSTEATGTASAANSVSVGDTVTLVISSNSSCLDMAFTVKYTRT
jgi:hypothetical protein